MRAILHESDVYLDGKRLITKEINLNNKFEIYVLLELFNSTGAKDINDFAEILEKKCSSTNEYGLALYSEFHEVFFSYMSEWHQIMAFSLFTFD
jgi:hypothetical protein